MFSLTAWLLYGWGASADVSHHLCAAEIRATNQLAGRQASAAAGSRRQSLNGLDSDGRRQSLDGAM